MNCKVRKFLCNYMIKNPFCAGFGPEMPYVDDENTVAVVEKVVVADVGGNVGLRSGSDSIGYHGASRAAAHGHARDDSTFGRTCAAAYGGGARFLYSFDELDGGERLGGRGYSSGAGIGCILACGAERPKVVQPEIAGKPCADASGGIVEAGVGRIYGHAGLYGTDYGLLLECGAGDLLQAVEQQGVM